MKLHDPNGSIHTIDARVSKKETETQVLSKYKDEAKKIADKMQSSRVKGKDSDSGAPCTI